MWGGRQFQYIHPTHSSSGLCVWKVKRCMFTLPSAILMQKGVTVGQFFGSDWLQSTLESTPSNTENHRTLILSQYLTWVWLIGNNIVFNYRVRGHMRYLAPQCFMNERSFSELFAQWIADERRSGVAECCGWHTLKLQGYPHYLCQISSLSYNSQMEYAQSAENFGRQIQ